MFNIRAKLLNKNKMITNGGENPDNSKKPNNPTNPHIPTNPNNPNPSNTPNKLNKGKGRSPSFFPTAIMRFMPWLSYSSL
ncbi:MAG: hypothetical protein FWG87_10235, partial [Defluviitaleaceae bacterium]|nr:hypothetical protein [Defluviitaleaceae bacterium]